MNSFSLHNINSALIAFRVGKIYGLSDDEIKRGIEGFKMPKMREEYLEIKDITIINDCYNSSYESMRGALKSLKNYAQINGKIPSLLVGDILEAGADAEVIHSEIGKMCKEAKIKHLFAFGKYANIIIDSFGRGEIFTNKKDISDVIISTLGKNDVLLVKASRGAHFEEIIQDMKEKTDG